MKLKGMSLVATAVLLAACSPKGEALYARAEKSLTAGEVNAAVIDLKNLVKAEPENAKARALLGLERAAEAKPQFEAAHAADANNFDALLGLASATYAIEGLPAARAVMEKASPEIQKKSAYWMAMGGIDSQGADFAAAEADYQKALANVEKGSEGGERLMALGALAETQMRQGKVKEATATAEQLAKAAPNNPLVKQLRGQVAAAGGKLDEARTLLEDAVAEMPDNMQARTLLGVVNLQQGNLGQAEMHFQNVLASQPKNVQAQKLLAETRARQQSPEESLESLKSVLGEPDADPSLLAMAGRMSLASGNREQALAYLTRASSKTSGEQPADVQLEVASGYLAVGDLDKAVELLEKMPTDGATGFQRELLLLAALLRKGETDKAVSEAKALVDRQGSDPQVRNLAAGVFAAAGQKDEARNQFNEALKLKPDDPGTLINLGRLDLSDRKFAEAEKNFAKALEADPKSMLAAVGMAAAAGGRGDNAGAEKWLQKVSNENPDSLEAQLALAQFYMGTRDFTKAKSVIDAAAKKAPDNAALSNARGLTQMGLNDIPGAIASFNQAIAQAPKAYGYTLNLARAHLANRDLKSAFDVLDGVLKAEPKYAPALSLAAATSLQSGQIEKATGYIERLRQAQPDAAGTFMLEGDLAMNQKRYKDALGFYRKAHAKGASSQLVLAEYRAASLAGESKPDKILEDWLAKNPGDLLVVPALGESRATRGDIDGAITVYETALAKAPENPVLLNNVAMHYGTKGSPKAVEYAERAYKASPQAPAIADTYGWLLFKQGKTDQAYDLIREAANKLPDNAEVQYHLAAVLAKQGKEDEAVTLLRKAVAGALPASVKTEAQKLLDQLTK